MIKRFAERWRRIGVEDLAEGLFALLLILDAAALWWLILFGGSK